MNKDTMDEAAAHPTTQQIETLARRVIADGNIENAARRTQDFVREVIRGLLDALPDRSESVSMVFQTMLSDVRLFSTASSSISSNARSGALKKIGDTRTDGRVDCQRAQPFPSPPQPTVAIDAQQGDLTSVPRKDAHTASKQSTSKGDQSVSQKQRSPNSEPFSGGNYEARGSQRSRYATLSSNLRGSEAIEPNTSQKPQVSLANNSDSIIARPDINSRNDASDEISAQLSVNPQGSLSQSGKGESSGSRSSDSIHTKNTDAHVILENSSMCPQHVDEIRHEKHDGIIRLYPTGSQYKSFSMLVSFARLLGADKDGICVVILPQSGQRNSLPTPADRVKVQMNRFAVDPQTDGTFQVTRTEQPSKLILDSGEPSPTASTDELVQRFESLPEDPNGFKLVRYYVDLDARQEDQRRTIGLASDSPIFPLDGNRLTETKVGIPGIHWPYAYVSGKAFGAPFAMHVEDCCLTSVNCLYAGEKIWFVLKPQHGKILEGKLAATGLEKNCSQFLRHSARYVPRSSLDAWGISYKLIRQIPNQVVITFPGAYHQGFSTGFTYAEAVNYADDNWSIDGYKFCNEKCPAHYISAHMVAPLREGELQQEQNEEDTDDDDEEEEEEEEEEGKDEEKRERDELSTIKTSIKGLKGTKRKAQNGLANGKFKRRKILKTFKTHIEDGTPSNLNQALKIFKGIENSNLNDMIQNTLVMLYCNIGSPQAILKFGKACAALREKAITSDHKGTITAYQALHSLDRLDNRGFAMLLLRRYFLVRLVECRKNAGVAYKKQRSVRKCAQRQPRSDTLALTELMAEVYPHLSDKNDKTYKDNYKSLQNRISSGNNWYCLVEEFGYGILGLVPTTDGVPNSLIEKLAHEPFKDLTAALKRHRGKFLLELSEAISLHMLSVISGQKIHQKFLFEEEERNLLEETEDSSRLIDLCGLKEA